MSKKLQLTGINLQENDGIDFFVAVLFFNFKKTNHHDFAHHCKRENQAP
ncbi:MAG: hypothetical protein RLZ76_1395 [Bacteroidota bacterium]|jgi:hypothetical protein